MHNNIPMRIKIKRHHDWARIPEYATDGSGCFDLYGRAVPPAFGEPRYPQAILFDLGISVEVPRGYVMMIYSRSGHGINKDIRLSNCVGVIDSDYRGTIAVKLRADSNPGGATLDDWANPHTKMPIRIAQAMIVPVPQVEFLEVDELSTTVRGKGGFGSTGT